MVSVWFEGFETPPPLAVADTVTVLFAASTELSTAVIVTVPLLEVLPAEIVSVLLVDKLKSPDTAGLTALAETVTVTAALDAEDSVAVTVLDPPFSDIEDGVNTSVTNGASSSVMVSVWLEGFETPPPLAVADTVTVLFAVSTELSTAVIVTVPVLAVLPAAIVSVLLFVIVKSLFVAGLTALAETVTVTAALDAEDSVAVTVLDPPLSEIEDGLNTSVTVGALSSSVMVSVWLEGFETPPPLAVADTVTVLFAAFTELSTAVIVTVPVLVVAPAAIDSVLFADRLKSPDTAGLIALAETVTVTTALEVPDRVAVTVLDPPFSEIEAGLRTSVTVGAPSSSVMVSVWFEGFETLPPLATPDTVTVLFAASTELSTAVIVTVPVLAVLPAAIVSVVLVDKLKSPDTAGLTALAETVTVTAALDAEDSVAVTVLDPPFSEIEDGLNTSVTVGVPSSSVMVSVWFEGLETLPPLATPDTVTVLFAASTELSTAVIVTVPVLAVLPAAIVRTLLFVIVKSLLVAGLTALAETVTVTAALDAEDSVAVTVLDPPFSEIEDGLNTSVTVGVPSSSVMVSVWFEGFETLPPLATPDTVTVLFGASTELSTAVIVTVPVLAVLPAAIVSVVFVDRLKSPATAGLTALADTVTVTAALDACDSAAVTVLDPPLSDIEDGLSDSDTVGTPSSSVMVSVWFEGPVTVAPLAEPETVTVLFAASTELPTAVIVTVPVLAVLPAAIVSVVFVDSVKSPATAGLTALAETVTVTAALAAVDSVAVTVLTPALSEIEDGVSTSVTIGASSSVMVSVLLEGFATPFPPLDAPETVTVLFAVSTELSTAVIVTVPVLEVLPAAIVRSLFVEIV